MILPLGITSLSNHSIILYTNDYTALFNNPMYMHLHREIKNAMYKLVLIAAIFDCSSYNYPVTVVTLYDTRLNAVILV